MSALGFFIVVIVASVILIALMLGLVFASETTRDLSPFFQAAVSIIIVFFSVMGLRQAKSAMTHHTVVFPAFTWQARGWMYPGQAMVAFACIASFGAVGFLMHYANSADDDSI